MFYKNANNDLYIAEYKIKDDTFEIHGNCTMYYFKFKTISNQRWENDIPHDGGQSSENVTHQKKKIWYRKKHAPFPCEDESDDEKGGEEEEEGEGEAEEKKEEIKVNANAIGGEEVKSPE